MPDPGDSGRSDRTVVQIPSAPSGAVPDSRAGTDLSSPPGAGRLGDNAHIAIGTVLNHIYRVDRLIARGGMGEVYEGTNVNSDERVAIKIVLPQLAGDTNVQTLFRNEARTLTKLFHPSVVQYRLLAQEPKLGVFYIVTEFIEGPSLADVLEKVRPTTRQLIDLVRRLASGLAAAHELGKIHRDLSPDNILLPDGRLDHAKIIDFGIAKNLDVTNLESAAKTIVGSGFAGKLGYVAPEQFGDTSHVGPWTDVYSLGLVALSVASGRVVDMGENFAQAVERRRSVPDLSAVPEPLRPVIGRMLQPDRTRRFQTMGEVLFALNAVEQSISRTKPTLLRGAKTGDWKEKQSGTGFPLRIAAGIALAVGVMAIISMFLFQRPSPPAVQQRLAPSFTPAVSLSRARIVAELAASRIACSWLQLDSSQWSSGRVRMSFSGVAEDPAVVSASLTKALRAKGLPASIDTSAVGGVTTSACPLLEAFGRIRAPGLAPDRTLLVHGGPFHLEDASQGCKEHSDLRNAMATADLAIRNRKADSALFVVQGDGQTEPVWTSRSELETILPKLQPPVESLDADTYRFTVCVDEHAAASGRGGYAGLLLLMGNRFSDLRLPMKTGRMAVVPPNWASAFVSTAATKGWTARMAWFRIAPPVAVANSNSGLPASGQTPSDAEKESGAPRRIPKPKPAPVIQQPVAPTTPQPIFTPAQSIQNTHSAPPYPQVALNKDEEGSVRLSLSIDERGNVTDATVVTSSGYSSLDAAAVAWVKEHWHYQPAIRDNKPVPDKVEATISFTLEKRQG